MKRILLWGIAAVVGLSLISCENKESEFVEPSAEPEGELFYATVEQPADAAATKVYADENLRVLWNAYDRVSIFNRYSFNRECMFMGETGDNAGYFKMISEDDFVVGNELEHIYSVYPYQYDTRISNDEVLRVTLPYYQPYAENSFGLGCNTMISATDTKELKYKNVGGYLVIKLYGAGRGVSNLYLKGNNDEIISGRAYISMPVDGIPVIVDVDPDDASTCIQLACDGNSDGYVALGATAESCTEFWFVLPPVTFEQGITLTVVDSNGNYYEKSTENTIAIERSRVARMAPISAEDMTQIDYYAGPVTGDSEWSLIGDFSQLSDNIQWQTDWVAVAENDCFVVRNVKLSIYDQFKFRKDRGWEVNRGARSDYNPFVMPEGESVYAAADGMNLAAPYDGIFDIWYNPLKEEMELCAAGTDPIWPFDVSVAQAQQDGFNNCYVRLSGIVSAVSMRSFSLTQDGCHVMVYTGYNAPTYTETGNLVCVGDDVQVIGLRTEYQGAVEITNTNLKIHLNSSGDIWVEPTYTDITYSFDAFNSKVSLPVRIQGTLSKNGSTYYVTAPDATMMARIYWPVAGFVNDEWVDKLVELHGFSQGATSKYRYILATELFAIDELEPKPGEGDAIVIDGDFADWDALSASNYSMAIRDRNSNYEALTMAKVYATPSMIYVLFQWNTDLVSYELGVEHVPFHVYLNTDGDATTGGFSDLFTDACMDVLLEGFIYPEGALGSYAPAVFPWTGEVNGNGWWWDGTRDLAEGSDVSKGAGIEGKYEFSIDRSVLASCGYPIADEFSIGLEIQQSWNAVGVLPSAAVSDENRLGRAPSMHVNTIKSDTK